MASSTSKHYGREALDFLCLQSSGVLSTHSTSCPEFPFGSLVPYVITPDKEFVIYISLISEHYRNLSENPRACLTVVDPLGMRDPQSYARASVMLEFTLREASTGSEELYRERFPASKSYQMAHNFKFLEAEVRRVRWIGGFGAIGWIAAEQFVNESIDQVAFNGWSAVEHMNEDHNDSLFEMLQAFTNVDLEHKTVQMIRISREGFLLAVSGENGTRFETISFLHPLDRVEDARSAMVTLLKKAREINGNH